MTAAVARRALVRWSWRMFRREWRQQILILLLLTLAVAGTVVGLGVITNATTGLDPKFGNAGTILGLSGDPNLAGDVAHIQQVVGQNEVIEDATFAVPGSVQVGDLRAEAPDGVFSHSLLHLVSGRYPTGATDVAVTSGVAADFNLRVGSVFSAVHPSRTVVGIVENPLALTDQFALVAPGQLPQPTHVDILCNASVSLIQHLNVHGSLDIGLRGTDRGQKRALGMLLLSTIALLFVGLLAVAAFTVMAQRRLRALGMLAAIGANDRQVRTVMLANGAVVGAAAAVIGMVSGVGAWFVFAPHLASIASHRVSETNLPWWAVGVAMGLAFLTAVLAAWWPAHGTTRVPIVVALSGRPPRPQPAHRFALLGAALLGGGLTALAFAHQRTPGLIIPGILATAIGALLLAPIATSALAIVAGRSPVPMRLAFRDLARNQARSGAAAAAIGLAVGVASVIAITSTAMSAGATSTPNLESNQLVVYLTADGGGPIVPVVSAAQLQTARRSIDQMTTALNANGLELDQAVDTTQSPVTVGDGSAHGLPAASLVAPVTGPDGNKGFSFINLLYVATPAVLTHYGIAPSSVSPTADVVSSVTGLAGLQIVGQPSRDDQRGTLASPVIQQVKNIPLDTSLPNVLITPSTVAKLHLTVLPDAWLITAPHPLTAAQIKDSQRIAAGVGLAVETRNVSHSLNQLNTDATIVGVLVALGVLAMTVGLVRGEAVNETRTLAATGASSSVRRSITAVTAGSLAVIGALLGVAGAYAAMAAWFRSNLSALGHVPFLNLSAIVFALPIMAVIGSWLLSGREPAVLGRRGLD